MLYCFLYLQSNYGGIKTKLRDSQASEAKSIAKKQLKKQSKKGEENQDESDSEEEEEEEEEHEELNLSDDEDEVKKIFCFKKHFL